MAPTLSVRNGKNAAEMDSESDDDAEMENDKSVQPQVRLLLYRLY